LRYELNRLGVAVREEGKAQRKDAKIAKGAKLDEDDWSEVIIGAAIEVEVRLAVRR
jgi:hypothetical protein